VTACSRRLPLRGARLPADDDGIEFAGKFIERRGPRPNLASVIGTLGITERDDKEPTTETLIESGQGFAHLGGNKTTLVELTTFVHDLGRSNARRSDQRTNSYLIAQPAVHLR
jgi:hypothetical protein